jgi:hypothetical protein
MQRRGSRVHTSLLRDSLNIVSGIMVAFGENETATSCVPDTRQLIDGVIHSASVSALLGWLLAT